VGFRAAVFFAVVEEAAGFRAAGFGVMESRRLTGGCPW